VSLICATTDIFTISWNGVLYSVVQNPYLVLSPNALHLDPTCHLLKVWTIRVCFSDVNRRLSATIFFDIVTISVGSSDINRCKSKLTFQSILVIFVHTSYISIFLQNGPEVANIRRLYKLWILKHFTWRNILSKVKSFPTTGFSFGLFIHFIK
jgi:hypothetical protein